MSKTANWSYTNKATVRPFVSIDQWSGVTVYGEEFEIDCTWTAKSEQMRDQEGKEFISNYEIYTENALPKYLDLIQLSGHTEWQEIRSRTEWDMSFFGEIPDYKLVT